MNMKRECLREYLKNQGDKTLKAKDSGSLNPKIKIWILFCRPCSFPTEVVDKLIKYQVNSFWVIVSVILTTALFNKTLILQREIWCWSLLGLKGLTIWPYIIPCPVPSRRLSRSRWLEIFSGIPGSLTFNKWCASLDMIWAILNK